MRARGPQLRLGVVTLALLTHCASKPLPQVAPSPASKPVGAAPRKEQLVEGPKCERHHECAQGFECTYQFSSWGRCVRIVSVAELLAWREQLDGITVVINTRHLTAIDWHCSTPKHCMAEQVFSVEDGHHGPVKNYIKLLSSNGAPHQCESSGPRACESWRSRSYKVIGRYDSAQNAFIVESLNIAV